MLFSEHFTFKNNKYQIFFLKYDNKNTESYKFYIYQNYIKIEIGFGTITMQKHQTDLLYFSISLWWTKTQIPS